MAETWKAGVGLGSSLSTASHARPPNPTEDLGLHPPQALIQRCLRPKTSGRHRAMSTLPHTRNHGAAIPASPMEPPPAWSPGSHHHRSPRDKLVSPDTPFQPRTGLAVPSTPLLRCSQAAPRPRAHSSCGSCHFTASSAHRPHLCASSLPFCEIPASISRFSDSLTNPSNKVGHHSRRSSAPTSRALPRAVLSQRLLGGAEAANYPVSPKYQPQNIGFRSFSNCFPLV